MRGALFVTVCLSFSLLVLLLVCLFYCLPVCLFVCLLACLFVCLIVVCLLADSQLFDLLCDACRPYVARRTHIGDFWFVLYRECV